MRLNAFTSAREDHIFAFVDDLAVGFLLLKAFNTITKVIDAFSEVSGLGVNRDKTQVMSASYDDKLSLGPTGHSGKTLFIPSFIN